MLVTKTTTVAELTYVAPWVDMDKFCALLREDVGGRKGEPGSDMFTASWYHQPGHGVDPIEGATVFNTPKMKYHDEEYAKRHNHPTSNRLLVAKGTYRGSEGEWWLSQNNGETRLPWYAEKQPSK